MQESVRSRRLVIAAACVAMLAGAGLGFTVHRERTKQLQARDIQGLLWPAPIALSSFSLRDQFGAVFDLDRLRGKWSFLFFGYTSCPDICPMTMVVLEQVSQQLNAQSPHESFQFVLVSVDPDRDTPERLREYVAFFDDSFIGISGPDENLRELSSQLGIMHIAAGPTDDENYLVDHSASILLIAPNLSLIGIFSAPHDPKDIASRAGRIVSFVKSKA